MKKTICVMVVALIMGSCTFYEDFLHPNVTNLEQLYKADTTYKHLASYSWRELFTDSLLQGYIEKGLEYNIDVRTAKYNIEAAEAALEAAKQAFLPSVSASLQTTLSGGDGSGGIRGVQRHGAQTTFVLPQYQGAGNSLDPLGVPH